MSDTATADVNRFALVKGTQRYLFQCDPGHEEDLIAQVMDWAENPDLDFDWFDAAVLSRQITQRLFGRVAGQRVER